MLITADYKQVLQETHQKYKWWGHGVSIRKWPVIKQYIEELDNVKTILDYGCANSNFKQFVEKDNPYTVYEYDPGIIGKDKKPEQADYVVCTDVLEHVEKECIEHVINHIVNLSKLGAFITISLTESRNTLSDGRNMHLLIKDHYWWIKHFLRRRTRVEIYSLSEKGLGLSIKIK